MLVSELNLCNNDLSLNHDDIIIIRLTMVLLIQAQQDWDSYGVNAWIIFS